MYTQFGLMLIAVSALAADKQPETDKKFDILFDQIDLLNAKIEGLQNDFSTREEVLLQEISDLKRRCKASESRHVNEGSTVQRAVSQTPIAFYAIAPDYDFSVMVANKSLVYQTPFTNFGNAFKSEKGIFRAPVRGVYVIFVTIGGNIRNSNYFWVDVAGKRMAHILMDAGGPSQSSQSIVVYLKPGDAVSVRAGRDKDGAYGAYFTSIGGFLLYENVMPATIGK